MEGRAALLEHQFLLVADSVGFWLKHDADSGRSTKQGYTCPIPMVSPNYGISGKIYQFFSDKLFTFDAEQKFLIVKKIYEDERFWGVKSRSKMSGNIKTPRRHHFTPENIRY